MLGKGRKRAIMLAAADALIVILSAVLSLKLRFNFYTVPDLFWDPLFYCIPVDIVIAVCVLRFFRLYNRVWSYASVEESISIFKASVCIEFLFIVYRTLFQIPTPRSFYIFDGVLIFLLFLAARFSRRIQKQLLPGKTTDRVRKRTMLVGAGSAASILIQETQRDSNSERNIVCIVDDNKNKKGKYLRNVPIVGAREDIPSMVQRYKIDEIIIAIPSATGEDIKGILEFCHETNAQVRILPAIAKGFTESVAGLVREVRYEDLLGRAPVKVNQTGIGEFIGGKTVLVTGGGGSIGSELCRQIVKYKPRRLIIFDIYENNAYDIQMELQRHYPELDITALIGSVRDYDRLEKMFREYRPQIIYHAAAHKHVPLMEVSPNEAIKNNCLGTLNVAKLADEYGAEKFTLISTDKAVRPTNIMGATKRICEMIIQSYAKKSAHTQYAAVRFGNVLGSNGSVIPLFLKQIDEGGPVTVTHKEITRFFMTIPEAVSLVLQASLFATGGEIFVLDMGKPVKIYELAENLIRMKGYKPNQDIMIEIVGLRPGEKLYEEILMDEEGLTKTANEMIFVGHPIAMDEDQFFDQLDDLIRYAETNGKHIKEKTAQLCTTYRYTICKE
ncbi:MAG TPA: polysaccharide biosynthesis protein [Candidatus Mediterraneibacter merdipullorum]|nr:polysaccharide biosynthesis protein [Candidatus Mediterraneibacter merdipullorum]